MSLVSRGSLSLSPLSLSLSLLTLYLSSLSLSLTGFSTLLFEDVERTMEVFAEEKPILDDVRGALLVCVWERGLCVCVSVWVC